MDRPTVIDLILHFISAVLFSAAIYLKTHNPAYVIIFVSGAIFIDLDHFVDYFLYFKNRFSLNDFLSAEYLKSGKLYVVLHSWELIFLFFLLSATFNSAGLFIFFLGLSIHIAIDNIQRRNPLLYFLAYRVSKRFDLAILMPWRKIT